ncbi:hypothetical protein KRR26_23440 [Corallococcus sp. M34]|uniref:ClpX C4-type zinc finger protein n=1 Tax=Citreicoccus inhibens TaxID=2849499 RepID=UPI001C223B6D|nr:ClpX C4-type zinc finger protein [Citreicoccus inhibens]MBU8898569.1 hypothetical protein [Citreicoccus inhibens]
MSENPRDLLRAAQSAESQGNTAHAVDCLQRAAALYQRAGMAARAAQLLRHAERLDAPRSAGSDAANRLMATRLSLDVVHAAHSRESIRVEETSALDARELNSLESIRTALDAEPSHAADSERSEWRPESEPVRSLGGDAEFLVGTPQFDSVPESEVEASLRQRLIDEALLAVSATDARNDEPTEQERWVLDAPIEADLQRLEEVLKEAPPRREGRGRRGTPRLIERGPVRAPEEVEAWCSFCCRPRGEVGALVASPAGAFICRACLDESTRLLSEVTAVPRAGTAHVASPPVAVAPVRAGQERPFAMIADALRAGARCVLLVGLEGSGKSTLLEAFSKSGQGIMATVGSLEEGTSAECLLVEDVDRLGPASQRALAAFLSKPSRSPVVLSARGIPKSAGWTLRGDAGRLFVPSTAGLSEAVEGRMHLAVLEHVQGFVPLPMPSRADFVEMAKTWLSQRSPAISLSEDVLAAFAAEALRSPRAGHELRALLSRVIAGSWRLEPRAKPARARGRGRRKGSS